MSDCPAYRPDHNGECLDCDEWADAHTPEALAAGQALAKDHPHAKLAQDCWGLIRGLRDPEDPNYDPAAIHLIEMACDNAAVADKTRALLRGTVRGYMAGENADSKHWRERAETAERRIAEVEAQLEAIEAVLRGEPVSDFMLSFPPVRIVAEAREFAGKIQYLVDWADANKLLEDHVFTFPDGDVWEAKKP